MPQLLGKTAILATTTGPWIDTNIPNVNVGVDGTLYTVQYHLGSDIVYSFAAATAKGVQIVPQSVQVRVVTGAATADYEVVY